MSRCLVTGAAGFLGSHLCEALLANGHEVVGLDCFIPYYPREIKERNLETARSYDRFRFTEKDLREAPLHDDVRGCDVVFHLAAMPGLMKSWSEFDLYATCNTQGTQRLLEAVRDEKTPQVIYVSTSSVYGREATGPEDSVLRPFSPYGITKLSAEQLCHAYADNFGVPVTILRYFSVYGPRQRPDMAYNILIRSLLSGDPFVMFGDGEQTRSNTYYTDCIAATLLAHEKRNVSIGQTFNVGGGEIVSLNQVLQLLREIMNRDIEVAHKPPRPGDQKHTAADIGKARRLLGYNPTIRVKDGLAKQIAWQTALMG